MTEPLQQEMLKAELRPSVPMSLVITVLNEATSISTFLDSIDALTVAPMEVVVVDGGSHDGTAELVRNRSDRAPAVKLIVAPGANISRGRNLAIANATHDFVAVTDAGTALEPDWLEKLYDGTRRGADVVSGFFRPGDGTWFEKVLGTLILPDIREVEAESFLPSSRSVALRKDAWRDVGGYPEWLDYCEDLVFDLRLKRGGYRFEFVPEAMVAWNARPSLIAFAKQYYRYARGDGKAGLWRKRHVARYVAYSLGVVSLIGVVVFPWGVALTAAGFFAYLVKSYQRAFRGRRFLGRLVLPALLLTPLIVVVGDVAKMAGYPAGLRWKWNQESTGA